MTSRLHPYTNLPGTAFWSRSVSPTMNPSELYVGLKPILKPSDRVVSAGSCFARNIVPFLENAGFHYVRTERIEEEGDRFGYGGYSAAYGNIYTALQLAQLLQRCRGAFRPIENRWRSVNGVVDPFRPGLPFPAEDDEEFDLISSSHLAKTLEAFREATVFVFTLGLTEAWMSSLDGAVFPACPGTVAGEFDPARHRFANFGAAEVVEHLRAAIEEVRALNPKIRIVLTVSPVPLVATATENHVVCATTYSKSVLRVACDEVCKTEMDTVYFPAYEIVMRPGAADNFEIDLRTVSQTGLKSVVDALFQHCVMPSDRGFGNRSGDIGLGAELSESLARYECEEMMSETGKSSAIAPGRPAENSSQ